MWADIMSEHPMSSICLSVQATSVQELLEQIDLHEGEASMVELRIDALHEVKEELLASLMRVLHERDQRVIWTVRWREEKGYFLGHEDERLALLQMGDRLGADYVDVELRSSLLERLSLAQSKKIVSHHRFDACPSEAESEELLKELKLAKPDVAKVAFATKNTAECLAIMRLYQEYDGSLVAIAMGEFGEASRLFGAFLGMPWTYAAADGFGGTAPGQYSVGELLDLYRYEKMTMSTRRFAVIGNPVSHSLSPNIHNRHYIREKLDAVYGKVRVDDMVCFYQLAELIGLEGVSVTVPHKEAIAKLTPKGSYLAKVGAANTLVRDDGKWRVENTDIAAALAAIEAQLEMEQVNPRVLMLGAGGVARALIYGMVDKGWSVTVTNRSIERVDCLLEEIPTLEKLHWEDRCPHGFDVVVNGTSLGMTPNEDTTALEFEGSHAGLVVFDTVYTPEMTLFLSMAKEVGARLATGREMFYRQAALQHQHWFGGPTPWESMESIVSELQDN
jgi:3-dehydroquinate dehydratase/shikimate dehydrogenase